MFATLKASSITFMPNAPGQTMRHFSPHIYVTMSPKLSLPRLKQLSNCMRHNPVDTKQIENQRPQLPMYIPNVLGLAFFFTINNIFKLLIKKKTQYTTKRYKFQLS